MQYNPDVHSCVVHNLRTMWREEYGPPDLSPLVMSDEEIWNSHEEMDRVTELTLCHMAYLNGVKIEGE